MGGFFIVPFFQAVWYSLNIWDGITEKQFVGVQNYIDLLNEPLFRASVGRVLQFAAIQPAVQVSVGIFFAYLLRKALIGGRFFRSVFFMPVVISSASVTLMFVLIYSGEVGPINNILRAIGLRSWARPWLATPETAFYAVIAVAIWQQLGMIFVILLAGMQGISNELFEAAEIDGANSVQSFFNIALPSLMPIISVCVVLGVSGALKNFDYVYILTRGGPSGATHVPATLMYERAFVGFRWGAGSAISVSIFLMGMIFTVLFNFITKNRGKE